MTGPRTVRRKRANGVESRQRILAAAVEIAGERGYEGTSIAAVSAKCGLPASSIYWHFDGKDDLIAAVIERSFAAWLTAVELPGEATGTPQERVTAMAANVAKSRPTRAAEHHAAAPIDPPSALLPVFVGRRPAAHTPRPSCAQSPVNAERPHR